jgi:hypothetical protein
MSMSLASEARFGCEVHWAITGSTLVARTGTAERYVRDWLGN